MSTHEFDRTDRVGAELRRALARLLRDAVRDPRLADLTVQEVRATRDLAHAKVFFTCLDGDAATGAVQQRLLNGSIASFLRRALQHEVRLRTIPQLHFVYDASIEHGEQLAHLIENAVAADRITDAGEEPEGHGETA